MLIKARERFESRLPVERPLTEPDIGLFLPGHYLVLIEAKFTSPNTSYEDGPRSNATSLTKQELLDIYSDSTLDILDVQKARDAQRVYYQLWRNMVFSEWMVRRCGKATKAYHASLTRAGFESESCQHFREMIDSKFRDRFSHITWETFDWKWAQKNPRLEGLHQYFASKTAGLLKAFS